jgi:hypothetical protein
MAVTRLVGPADDAHDEGLPPDELSWSDEPSWFEDVGKAVYRGSAAVGRAIGEQTSRLADQVLGRRTSAQSRVEEQTASVEEEEAIDEVEEDDLERRFRDLERQMRERG